MAERVPFESFDESLENIEKQAAEPAHPAGLFHRAESEQSDSPVARDEKQSPGCDKHCEACEDDLLTDSEISETVTKGSSHDHVVLSGATQQPTTDPRIQRLFLEMNHAENVLKTDYKDRLEGVEHHLVSFILKNAASLAYESLSKEIDNIVGVDRQWSNFVLVMTASSQVVVKTSRACGAVKEYFSRYLSQSYSRAIQQPGGMETSIQQRVEKPTVSPARSAVREQSFSALNRVKTYLRATTGDSRLNHMMILHARKDKTDTLNLVDVAINFVGEKAYRKQFFDLIPAHVLARGKTALAAYHRALKTGGGTYDKRVKVLLVGQDRVGKTSLSKSLRGEPFNNSEPSTDGVQMIPPIKNAGTTAWRNPAPLEQTTVFDHKITANLTKELLSSPSQLSESLIKNVTEDKTLDISTKDEEQDLEINSMPEDIALLLEQLLKKEVDQDDTIWPVIWDFAGQDIYRAIHPIYMSSEDICLLVFDLTKKLSALAECRVNVGHGEDTVRARDCEDTNLDHVLRWMDLIHTLKKCDQNEESAAELSHPPVIVVGTHADCVDDPSKEILSVKRKLSHVLGKVLAKHIANFLPVDNSKAGEPGGKEKIIALRKEILELADQMPHTKKEIPLQWHRVEKEISKPAWQIKKYLEKKMFRKDIVSQYCTFDDENDFDELIYFLHARGSIVYHEHTGDKDGLVILDPQWLINVLCEIVKVKSHAEEQMCLTQAREDLQEKGILRQVLIDNACKKKNLDPIKDCLISLMEKFNLICKWPAKNTEDSLILVPCMLTTRGEEENEFDDMTSNCPAPVYLTFSGTKFVPGGLFCRLVVLFGRWLSNPQYTHMYELHANKAQFALDKDHLLQLVCYKTVMKLKIFANVDYTPSEHCKNVLSHLKEFMETLKKECLWLRSMSENLCARCEICLGSNQEPCTRHEERECRHHDCSHYIPLNSGVLCCKPGHSMPQETLEPWMMELNLSSTAACETWSLKGLGEPPTKVTKENASDGQITEGIIKDGVVVDDDLEGLSLKLGHSWVAVARRLKFCRAEITAFSKNNEEYTEKALNMLEKWKEKYGSEATYQVLYQALCHEFVECKDLAQKFCMLDC